jgi:membrane-bound ClpP family serine protease
MGAVLLTVAGMMAFTYELGRPGMILPGILGLGAVVAGVYHICGCSPSPLGSVLLGLGALLCIVHALAGNKFTALIATATIAFGGWTLFRSSGIIFRCTVLILALILGGVATLLLSVAHAGRQLKQSSL